MRSICDDAFLLSVQNLRVAEGGRREAPTGAAVKALKTQHHVHSSFQPVSDAHLPSVGGHPYGDSGFPEAPPCTLIFWNLCGLWKSGFEKI